MIGDSAADVSVARNAHVPVVVLPYGYTRVPAVELGADAVLDNARQLLDLLPG
jgi:phosphoglycolate phosphatase